MALTDFQRSWTLLGIILAWAVISVVAQDSDQTAEQFVSTHSHDRLTSDFFISLFQNLSMGKSLNKAAGRPEDWSTVSATDTIRTLPAIAAYQDNQQQLMYKFNVSQIELNENQRTLELRLRLPPSWRSRRVLRTLTLTGNSCAPIYASTIPTATTRLGSDEVTIMDITLVVRDWLESAKSRKLAEDLTLDLVFSAHVRKRSTLPTDGFGGFGPFEAILIVYEKGYDFPIFTAALPMANATMNETDSDLGDFSLPERAYPPRAERSAEIVDQEMCQRKDMHVDIRDVGWKYRVVFPTKFNAYQCGGQCEGFANVQKNRINRVVALSLMRMFDSSVPTFCCVSTKLSPLNFLYLDDNGELSLKHFPDMIAEECGCMM